MVDWGRRLQILRPILDWVGANIYEITRKVVFACLLASLMTLDGAPVAFFLPRSFPLRVSLIAIAADAVMVWHGCFRVESRRVVGERTKLDPGIARSDHSAR